MESKAYFKRKENWNTEEVEALVQAISEYKDVLTARLSMTVTSERKAKTWEKVVERVNSVSVSRRDAKEVKKKWQTYQSNVKAKECQRLREANGTGGGPRPKDLTETEKCALVTIPKTMLSGISGGLDTECDDSYGTCSTVEDLDDSCGNTCTQVEDHIVPEKVACNAGENSKSSTIENSRKRKSAVKSPSTDIDEDFHSKLLKIEERKLEIEEEKLRLQREQLEAIKQIAFVLQSSQLDNILQL